jgi:hypothetical protein
VKYFLWCVFLLAGPLYGGCQVNWITPDHVYANNIKSVRLVPAGAPLSYPIISLLGTQTTELSFDDLDGDVKNYYYTLQLCNADWTPSDLTSFDYLSGFANNRLENYRFSNGTLQKYTHFTLDVPNSNCLPKRSGNYLLKIFLNDDTSQLVLTRRLLVVENKASIVGYIQQPINPELYQTGQKVNFNINISGMDLSNVQDEVKLYILQDYRWDNAITGIQPTFINGAELDYNTENDCIFPAMKEWRLLDMRSLEMNTEHVQRIFHQKDSTDVYVYADPSRVTVPFQARRDINGMYIPELIEQGYSPDYEGDYATVHFSFPVREPYAGSDLYIFGELTNYECGDANKLTYNPDRQAYEGSLFLKEGYYNYIYGLIDRGTDSLKTTYTEGNWWETENTYTILVYYRALGDRADQLIGAVTLNSVLNRK